ncbi:uncharacterized protein LOC117676845 [Pantherophis guttatus]|uniref:Uncharacterized protein LOC117676845 n=1 Tax=Pantherophis guttatus TaxID=94885 RepID=A0A6P9D9W1_PANGU|nr:uncharacterized protein LOC117676845 [Pantherophis guttatus]
MDCSPGSKPCLGHLIQAVVVFLSLLGLRGFDLKYCGMHPKHQSGKDVTDGHHALPGTWPWLISIQIYTPKGPKHSCDGAVVDVRWILTAAHCFSAKENSLKVWKIVLGATDLSRLPDIAQIRSIKRIVFHQDYNPSTKINDVALIELDHPVTFNDYVQPICLPLVSLDSEAFSICYVSGWNSSGISAVVYEARANILETMTCNGSEWYHGGMNPHTLCASLKDKDDHFCQGHGGGLLMCKTLPKSPYYIVGISNLEKDCDKVEYPKIYTSVQQFLEWISRKMRSEEIPKEKLDHNTEDSSSTSITEVPKDTLVIEPPFIPQETVPTLLEPPYVPEETTPSPPVSPFIPTETKLILEPPSVDKPSHSGPKSVDSSMQYPFLNTTVLPPEYVPPEAEVTLEPPYIPLETPGHLEAPYIPPETFVSVEPPYILLETTAALELPYTPQETTVPLELPYTPTETSVPLENPYIPSETSATLKPPYVPEEIPPSLEAPYNSPETYPTLELPYTPPETPATLEPPYTPTEAHASLKPPYIPPETPANLEPPYTLPETPAPLEPPYTPPETSAPLEPPYTPPETPAPLEPPYRPPETPAPLEPPYTPPETPAPLEPPYTPPETPAPLEPPYKPPEAHTSPKPPYIAPETPAPLETPCIPLETLNTSPGNPAPINPPCISPYIPPETPAPLESPFISSESSTPLEPPYIPLEIPLPPEQPETPAPQENPVPLEFPPLKTQEHYSKDHYFSGPVLYSS